jgi:hypothetical protein
MLMLRKFCAWPSVELETNFLNKKDQEI